MSSIPPFLAQPDSAVAAEIAARDWSGSAIGEPVTWPAALRTTIATMLACPTPMFLAWGPELLSFYNDAYRPILGYRATYAIGMPFPELWASIWDEIAPLVDRALRGEQTSVADMKLDLSRDNEPEESYWSFTYSPAFDEEGRVSGMLCVTGETTARVLSERARAAADERLQLALSAGNSIGAWDWDIIGDCVRSDRRFAALYGVDPERAERGAPIAEFFAGIHPDDLPRVQEEIARSLEQASSFRSEYRLLRGDGEVRWVAAQGIPVLDEEGRRVRFPGVSFDVTDRIASEARLRESEAQARANAERVQLALSAGAIIGTWFWDLRSDRISVDEAFARSFGLDPVLGRDGLKLEEVVATVHPDDREGLAEAIGEGIARGGAYAHQYRVRRYDGRYYWIEANGRVDHADDGTPLAFQGVAIDVDARRSIEAERDNAIAELRGLTEQLEQRVADRTAELMRAEEALRQAQKMEAVGQLTGGLAHDFNNLLAGISGSLEMIGVRLRQGRQADVDRYIEAAQGAARRAAALTHRLLAFSRRQTLAPRPVDTEALVDGMTDLIRRTVGPSVTVELQSMPELWTALVDASQLENALLNLCINARDAMPDGGTITIAIANERFDTAAARSRDLPAGEYLSLCVADTGSGIPPEIVNKVFDPFFTTKPLGQGTGLGLSMIYGFAQQSGGQVRIASDVGRGTSVCIYLPRHHGAVARDEAKEKADQPVAGRGETVLVVDDEESVRRLIVDALGDLGYSTIEAEDSVSGLRVLRSASRIDLLVTDVGLPGGMNGRQMADAGREWRPNLVVLFVTGYAEQAVLDHGRLVDGMHVLTKPFSLDTLATRVRHALGADAPITAVGD